MKSIPKFKPLKNISKTLIVKNSIEIRFAFKNFEVFSSLNSFYDAKFADKKEEQIKNLKKYVKEWKGEDNLVLITHYVVILAVLDKGTSSGEILISNNNFKTLGSIIIK